MYEELREYYNPELLGKEDKAFYRGMDFIQDMLDVYMDNIEDNLKDDTELTFFHPLIEEIVKRVSNTLNCMISVEKDTFLIAAIENECDIYGCTPEEDYE